MGRVWSRVIQYSKWMRKEEEVITEGMRWDPGTVWPTGTLTFEPTIK